MKPTAPTKSEWRAEYLAIYAGHEMIGHCGMGFLPPHRSEESLANAQLMGAAQAMKALLQEAVDDVRQRAMPDKDWLKKSQELLKSLDNSEGS